MNKELSELYDAIKAADVDTELASSASKSKAGRVWLLCLCVHECLTACGIEPTRNLFRVTIRMMLGSILPSTLTKGDGQYCKQVLNKDRSFYTHDGHKIAIGGTVAKQSRATLASELRAMPDSQAYFNSVVLPVLLALKETHRESMKGVAKVKAKAGFEKVLAITE